MKGLDGIIDSVDMCEQIPGVTEKQGSLACCSPWGRVESDITEQQVTRNKNSWQN